jgi:CHAD domain-containing protein
MDEKNIHDIRVSIRRVDVALSLLPKKDRRHSSRRFEKYLKLLRANGEARDCDTIASRLATLGVITVSDLRVKKRSKIARAVIVAASLKKLPLPTIDMLDDKRVDKISSWLIGRIKETFPIVLNDGRRVKELHRIRRDVRKLRYILDFLPDSRRSVLVNKLNRATGNKIELQRLQDLLGSIHDCDVTLEYLRSQPNFKELLAREIDIRNHLYIRFFNFMKNKNSRSDVGHVIDAKN